MKNEVHGNTRGIRKTLLDEMCALYECRMQPAEFLSAELLDALVRFTCAVNREILVYASRQGEIVEVRVGDSFTVALPELRLVRNVDRLCGVRCIHTHPGGDGMLSDVDMGSLNVLRLDAMAAVGVQNGRATTVYAGFIGEMDDGVRQTELYGPLRPDRLPQKRLMDAIFEADKRLLAPAYAVTQARPERAILAGIESSDGYDSLGELAALCETAGLQVVERALQRKRSVDNATYLGSGKAEELALTGNAAEADLFVFDDELTAVQLRNLEEILGLPIVDRTMLILDIFAQRAQSREGKLQVELAQLQYRLPRLLGMGKVLSRQGGSGVGMRGPGEKKLEIDRRRIRRRVYELQRELAEIEKQRGLRRDARSAGPTPLVALVGYTNAGKSTLLNALSGSDALAEDKLFATLDPILRRVRLPSGAECMLSDTVGFINKLPHDLIDAFRSTLDEVKDADLILHVIDTASPYFDVQIRVVEGVLGELGAADTPCVRVYNKIDAAENPPPRLPGAIAVSAKTGEGLEALLARVEELLAERQHRVELTVPYDRYEAVELIRRLGNILSETHESDGTHITALLHEDALWRVKKLLG